MESTENSVYSLLISISQDVGEFKSEVKNLTNDIKELQEQVNKFNENAMKSDEKIVTKLEEYFDYAKKRQDSIKETLEMTISDHEKRIVALEDKTKNKLWSLFEKFKVALVSAIILAMVGLCLKFGGELIKALKEPIQKTIGG